MKKILIYVVLLGALGAAGYYFYQNAQAGTTTTAPAPAEPQAKVIAHRGYWNIEGSAQNSLTALSEAQRIGAYGSEFDVQMTADDELIVVHGHGYKSIPDVRKVAYEEIKAIPLDNGEIVPLLSDYLDLGAKNKDVKLILEIKDNLTPERETAMVEKILAMVKEKGLESQVEYIAFSLHVCKELVRLQPGVTVAYLMGDITPTQAKEYGFTGIDYNYGTINEHPDWVKESHDNGLTVNVWTVSSEEDIRRAIEQGVDFITTDAPELAQKLVAEK